MAYEEMSIAELVAEGNRIESEVAALRRTQLEIHTIAEKKRYSLPIIASPLDQNIGAAPVTSEDWIAWAKKLPADAWAAIMKAKEGL